MADWTPGPHFKEPAGSPKVARALKRMDAKAKEDKEKGKVRKRDKRCRFPMCGCKKFHLRLDVSHKEHKGMGGNRTGDRSQPEKMIYVCSARHRENRFSIDRGTIEWRPLTIDGANGPVAWYADVDTQGLGFAELGISTTDGWFLLATERSIGVYEPVSDLQLELLRRLSEMKL